MYICTYGYMYIVAIFYCTFYSSLKITTPVHFLRTHIFSSCHCMLNCHYCAHCIATTTIGNYHNAREQLTKIIKRKLIMR